MDVLKERKADKDLKQKQEGLLKLVQENELSIESLEEEVSVAKRAINVIFGDLPSFEMLTQDTLLKWEVLQMYHVELRAAEREKMETVRQQAF